MTHSPLKMMRPLFLDTPRHIALSDSRGVRLFEGHFEAGAPLPIVLGHHRSGAALTGVSLYKGLSTGTL